MHSRRLSQVLLVLLTVANLAVAQQPAKRLLKLDDLARVREVRDPQLSPDGQWIAYVLSGIETKEDKSNAHIWMVGYDGKNDRQLTFSQESENSPRWSPDGKYLSFTSSRPGKARAKAAGCSLRPPVANSSHTSHTRYTHRPNVCTSHLSRPRAT